MVPLARLKMQTVCLTRGWLIKNLPEWAEFGVEPVVKHLGFFLGPAANLETFLGPLAKHRKRTVAIGSSLVPPTAAIKLCNSKAGECAELGLPIGGASVLGGGCGVLGRLHGAAAPWVDLDG